MSGSKVPPSECECTHHCQSAQHGAALTSAVSMRCISEPAAIAYLHWRCANCGQAADRLGRSALHVAASCGRCDVARWLVRHAEANMSLRDPESGYTPLHRSVFYGQIHVAVALIHLGASVSCLDYDELTALDHAMKDRMPYVEFNLTNPCEVYTWGTNNNYTLGVGNQHGRPVPELLDSFRKQNISIKQVAMHKFHSVFVSHDGRAFSCGHGQGGRLGLDSEQAALAPNCLRLGPAPAPEGAAPVLVSAVSVGRDHTVLLTDSGGVWTCGLNSHHQLGHVPPPPHLLAPRALPPRALKGAGGVRGVCASRFHTVVWGPRGLLTCGLNAGQLGHARALDQPMQSSLRLVAALAHKESQVITHVAASDGATVVVTLKGDIYALHEYQCRKIASRLLDVVKVEAVGGHLDSRAAGQLLERGGEELRVAVLTGSGRLLLWQESSQQLLRCLFSLNRPLAVTDVTLSRASQLLLVTRDGEAFEGELKTRKPRKHPVAPPAATSGSGTFHEFLDRLDCEQVRVKRLQHIHRAVSVASDPKGRNFAVIQTHPQAALLAAPVVETSEMQQQMRALLETAHTQDSIHDVVFLVGGRELPAHRFVVFSRSEPLAKMIQDKAQDSDLIPRIKINNVKADVFEQILQYIYTNECTLLKSGECPIKVPGLDNSQTTKENFEVDLNKVSAFQVYSEENSNKKNKSKQASKKSSLDPVKLVQEAARRFGLSSLQKKLDGVRYEEGYIVVKDRGLCQPGKGWFDLKHHQDLQDVTVQSEDGQGVRAHKCVLVARLEYFSSMLQHGWLQPEKCDVLRLPVPHRALELLLAFVYQDDSPAVRRSDDLDMVCGVLIVADQLFVTRLKEICEVTLAGLVTLRNVAEIFQFADMYNAGQLKQCCMQYICLNLSAALETHILECVSGPLLEDLSKYYREFNPNMSRRDITPYSEAPDQEIVEAVADAYPVSNPDGDSSEVIDSNAKRNHKLAKKKSRVRKVSINENNKLNERVRNESVTSNQSANSDEGEGKHLSLEDLTEKSVDVHDVTLTLSKLEVKEQTTPPASAPWVKATGSSKQHKVVLARLKAINAAKETPTLVQPSEEQFTRLLPASQRPAQTPAPATPQSPPAAPVPVSPPPNLILDFPELNSPPATHHEPHKPLNKAVECKKLTKISQKQRKKMAAAAELSEPCEKVSQSPRCAWAVASESGNSSLVDIMRAEQQSRQVSAPVPIQPTPAAAARPIAGSPGTNPWQRSQTSPAGSPDTAAVRFCDIVADEKKQRDNWTKMRAKPLELTQLEDRAIEELLLFYNAAGVPDERISVQRVLTGAVAPPTWITSHH